jgi:hypothetical protein
VARKEGFKSETSKQLVPNSWCDVSAYDVICTWVDAMMLACWCGSKYVARCIVLRCCARRLLLAGPGRRAKAVGGCDNISQPVQLTRCAISNSEIYRPACQEYIPCGPVSVLCTTYHHLQSFDAVERSSSWTWSTVTSRCCGASYSRASLDGSYGSS